MCTTLRSYGVRIAYVPEKDLQKPKPDPHLWHHILDKYLAKVFGVSLRVAARQYVFSSRRYEPARSISVAEWGSPPERCQVAAGSSRGTRCRWCRCCWIPGTARLPPSPRSGPPTRPRTATPPCRRRVACRARHPVAWRRFCRCRCWSSLPRTPASWPRRAAPWPCRASRLGPGGVRGPPEPPDQDNFGPSWPRKSRASGRQRSRNWESTRPRSTRLPPYSPRLSLAIFFSNPLRTPESSTAQRSKVGRRVAVTPASLSSGETKPMMFLQVDAFLTLQRPSSL